MENVFLTSLTIPELKKFFRDELQTFYTELEPTKAVTADDDFLTIEEAGEFLKLQKATLYGLTSASKIPYSKRGKRLYFLRSELASWIKKGRRRTVKEIENAI